MSYGLTPQQRSALDVIEAAPNPISRYALSMALGLVKSAGYRLADQLEQRGHARLTDEGLVRTGLQFIAVIPARRFSDGSVSPAHCTPHHQQTPGREKNGVRHEGGK